MARSKELVRVGLQKFDQGPWLVRSGPRAGEWRMGGLGGGVGKPFCHRTMDSFWSSAIAGRFPETADRGDIRSTTGKSINHRVYAVTTKDFETYSDTHLFYDGGFVSIDASLLERDGAYLMFIKDETKRPEPEKNIRLATAPAPQGPWSPASEPFSPEGVWVEGPTATEINGKVYVYFDAYMEHAMMAMRSADLTKWEDISDQLTFPEGSRHGSVLPITRERLDALLAAE